jgi:hypothetical protein
MSSLSVLVMVFHAGDFSPRLQSHQQHNAASSTDIAAHMTPRAHHGHEQVLGRTNDAAINPTTTNITVLVCLLAPVEQSHTHKHCSVEISHWQQQKTQAAGPMTT